MTATVAALLALAAGACGGDSDTEAAAPEAARPATLEIKDFAFGPQPLEVAAGTVLTVTNADDAAHTATADDGSFDTGTLALDQSAEVTLSEPGEVAFHCTIHDYMQGVIRVAR